MTNPDTDEARALLAAQMPQDNLGLRPMLRGADIHIYASWAIAAISAALTRAREAEAQISTLTDERDAAQAEIAALRADVDTLTAQLEQARTWQPIETAPRDGNPILAYVSGRSGIDEWQDVIHWYDKPGVWLSADRPVNPSRWMPLPADPSIAKGEG